MFQTLMKPNEGRVVGSHFRHIRAWRIALLAFVCSNALYEPHESVACGTEKCSYTMAIVTKRHASLKIGSTNVGDVAWGDVLTITSHKGRWLWVAPIDRIQTCGRRGWIDSSAVSKVQGWAKIIAFFDDELKRDPRNDAAYLHRGWARCARDQNTKLLFQDANAAISVASNRPLGYVLRAIAHGLDGNFDRVLADCDKALAVDSGCVPALYERSALYLRTNQYDAALADVDRAIVLGTKDPRFFIIRSYTLRQKGQMTEAFAAINQGLKYEPTCTEALEERHDLYLEIGNLDAAYADIDEAVRESSDNASCLSKRAVTGSYLGNFDRSQRDIRAAVEMAPTNEFVAWRFVSLCCGIQGARDALGVLDKCIERNRRRAYLHELRGRLLTVLGRDQDAIEAYSEAIMLAPQWTRLYIIRATLHEILGDRGSAAADFATATRLEPRYAAMKWPRNLFTPAAVDPLEYVVAPPPAEMIMASFDVPLFSNGIVVPITLGERHCRMLLDTGSSTSIFDNLLRPLLGNTRGRKRISTFSAIGLVDTYAPVKLMLGGVELIPEDTWVATHDIHERSTHAFGGPIHGALGADYLKTLIIRIDPGLGKLFVLRNVPDDAGDRLPARLSGSAEDLSGIFIPVSTPEVGGHYLSVDTGNCFGSLTIQSDAVEAAAQAGSASEVGVMSARELFVDSAHKVSVLAHVSALGYTHNYISAWEVDSPETIGLMYLRRFVTTIDFGKKQIYVRPSPSFADSEAQLALKNNKTFLDMAIGTFSK